MNSGEDADDPSKITGGTRMTALGEGSCKEDWHLIPELRTLSVSVQDAAKTGIIQGKARKEIIQVLRTYIQAYTHNPSPEQYNTVCSALVAKYPNLKDGGGQCQYVSEKLLTWYTLCCLI